MEVRRVRADQYGEGLWFITGNTTHNHNRPSNRVTAWKQMWFKNNLIHPFNRYLLNIHYVPGTIPGARIIHCYSCWNCRQIIVNKSMNEDRAWILESPWMRWGQKVRYNNPKPRWQHRHSREVTVWQMPSSLEMSSTSILIRGLASSHLILLPIQASLLKMLSPFQAKMETPDQILESQGHLRVLKKYIRINNRGDHYHGTNYNI